MSVRMINDAEHFQAELAVAGIRLVVANFTATWCGSCQRIKPQYDALPGKFPNAIFLKVDVDKCQNTADRQGVSAMPTFILYRNRTEIDRLQGADIVALEQKIQKHVGESGGDESIENFGQGLMDLNSFISMKQCECLNEADDHPLSHCLVSAAGCLRSDCDGQLIISITFNQLVKVHSLKFTSPPLLGPKDIKLFINQPHTIGFDQADSMMSIQELCLDAKDLEKGSPVNLRFVKFQNVQNLQIFVKNNQSGGDVTQIDYLGIVGAPIMTTKMDNFRRIAGKKGESH